MDKFILIDSISSSIIFSVIVSLVFIAIYAFRIRNLGNIKITEQAIKETQIAEFEINQGFELAKQRIENLFSKVFVEETSKSAHMSIFSIWSWSKISINLLDTSDDKFRYKVVVKPIIPINIFDFTENYRLLSKINNVLVKSP